MALDLQLLTVQILTNNFQVLILCLSYFITTLHTSLKMFSTILINRLYVIVDIIGQSIGRSDVVSKVEIIQIFPILEMSNLKHPTSNMKEQLSFFFFHAARFFTP